MKSVITILTLAGVFATQTAFAQQQPLESLSLSDRAKNVSKDLGITLEDATQVITILDAEKKQIRSTVKDKSFSSDALQGKLDGFAKERDRQLTELLTEEQLKKLHLAIRREPAGPTSALLGINQYR